MARHMENRWILNQDAVVRPHETLFKLKTLSVEELTEYINGQIGRELVGDGVRCRVLQPGDEWREGRIKVVLEFIPDHSQS